MSVPADSADPEDPALAAASSTVAPIRAAAVAAGRPRSSSAACCWRAGADSGARPALGYHQALGAAPQLSSVVPQGALGQARALGARHAANVKAHPARLGIALQQHIQVGVHEAVGQGIQGHAHAALGVGQADQGRQGRGGQPRHQGHPDANFTGRWAWPPTSQRQAAGRWPGGRRPGPGRSRIAGAATPPGRARERRGEGEERLRLRMRRASASRTTSPPCSSQARWRCTVRPPRGGSSTGAGRQGHRAQQAEISSRATKAPLCQSRRPLLLGQRPASRWRAAMLGVGTPGSPAERRGQKAVPIALVEGCVGQGVGWVQRVHAPV